MASGLCPWLASQPETADSSQDQDDIATAIAQAFGHSLSGQQPARHQLRIFLRDRKTLLILDNFEHLLDGADLVLDLLQHAPHLSILCTSRQPLGFMAEWVYALDQLPLPPAPPTDPSQWLKVVEVDIASYASVQLFVDRATRVDGRFALTPTNENDIAHLCRLVAGIPLGLELAAASLRQRPLAQLIHTIEGSLANLAISLRDLPPRHRSLRAVFENSWELLTAVEQKLFASLSIFRGGFDASAAQIIAAAADPQIQNLCQKSLLYTQGSRTHMHEYLRQFAAEKRLALGLDKVPFAHSHYYLTFVAQQEAALTGESPPQAAQQIADNLDNIRRAWQTAVDHQQSDTLAPCLSALADFYQIRGLYREALQQFGQAAAQFSHPQLHAPLRAHLLTHQAGAANRLSDYTIALDLIAQALALAVQADDQWAIGKLHIYWGEALWRQGELAQAEAKLNHAWEIAEALPSRPLAGSALFHLGIVHDYKGNYETALGYLDSALLIWRLLRNLRQQGFALNSIGGVARHLPDLVSRAQIALTEALSISKANRDIQGQSMALNNLSLLATEREDYKAAKSYLTKALQLAEFGGDTYGQALLTYNLGWNARKAGGPHEAKSYAELALNMSRQIGDQPGEGRTLKLLGDLEKDNGYYQQALTHYQAALTIYQHTENQNMQQEMERSIQEAIHQLDQQRQVQHSPLLK